ncbi:MAG: phage holin family protein [Gemmatimonadetes bacterium]|nr:phage holin family protein [Gemmatimonadota bacterium]
MRFLVRLLVTAAALWCAVRLLDGITYEGSWTGLLGVALVFGLVNAIIRPILYFLTCPFILLTLGLFIFIINALMLLLSAGIANRFGIAFHVDGLLTALVGSVIISVVSAILSIFVPDQKRERKD